MINAKLVVIKGKASRKEIELHDFPVLVGRNRHAGLPIAHPLVSREHCEIDEFQEAIVVRDLGSANGTYINSRQIRYAVLEPGDRLSIGPLTFVAVYEHEGPFPELDNEGLNEEEEEVYEFEEEVEEEEAGPVTNLDDLQPTQSAVGAELEFDASDHQVISDSEFRFLKQESGTDSSVSDHNVIPSAGQEEDTDLRSSHDAEPEPPVAEPELPEAEPDAVVQPIELEGLYELTEFEQSDSSENLAPGFKWDTDLDERGEPADDPSSFGSGSVLDVIDNAPADFESFQTDEVADFDLEDLDSGEIEALESDFAAFRHHGNAIGEFLAWQATGLKPMDLSELHEDPLQSLRLLMFDPAGVKAESPVMVGRIEVGSVLRVKWVRMGQQMLAEVTFQVPQKVLAVLRTDVRILAEMEAGKPCLQIRSPGSSDQRVQPNMLIQPAELATSLGSQLIAHSEPEELED